MAPPVCSKNYKQHKRSGDYSQGVGHKYSLEDMVAAVANVALRDGVAKLTFRNVAEELGTSDRMVVYYFPGKDDLVSAAIVIADADIARASFRSRPTIT
jgi:DNA-binding transcriptional regulator YbjK